MVDRQDIDALLISALYGELTPADEARLTAHLESHPADRTALADLTRARAALRESRILTVQLEPPQSVSALLLQEAARRAPRPVVAKSEDREGWFERFLRSFAARPMMAAAAMLVVMLGVAGTIKMTGGKDAQYTDTAEPSLTPLPPADEAQRWGTGLAGNGAPASASVDSIVVAGDAGIAAPVVATESAPLAQAKGSQSFDVTLAEERKPSDPTPEVTTKLDPPKNAEKPKLGYAERDGKDTTQAKKPAPKRDENTYLDVRTQRPPQPKELEDEDRRREGAGAKRNDTPTPDATTESPGAGGGGATRGLEGRTPAVTAPPPVQRHGGEDKLEQPPEDLSAARSTHNEVVAAVKARDCAKAGRIAADLAMRAPNYYQSQVQPDRDIKSCIATINAAREREQTRVRALKQRQTDDATRRPAAPANRR
jgi:anti-sigma factor RsiW